DNYFYQTTSTALTTVRWPLNFKDIPTPIPGYQYNFAPGAKRKWDPCKDGPAPCGGGWSGLISASIVGKDDPCHTWFAVGGNLPIQSAHGAGAMVLFADGHVAFLTEQEAGNGLVGLAGRGSVLERLCVRNDSQVVEVGQ